MQEIYITPVAIAGFVEKTSGELMVNDEEIKKPDRNRGVVFSTSRRSTFSVANN
ncbi:hypothetical protein ACT7DH_05380 [Bacillus pacificus]